METKCTCEEESKYGFHFGCGYCRGKVQKDQDQKKAALEKLDEFEQKLKSLDNWGVQFQFDEPKKNFEKDIKDLAKEFKALRKEILK